MQCAERTIIKHLQLLPILVDIVHIIDLAERCVALTHVKACQYLQAEHCASITPTVRMLRQPLSDLAPYGASQNRFRQHSRVLWNAWRGPQTMLSAQLPALPGALRPQMLASAHFRQSPSLSSQKPMQLGLQPLHKVLHFQEAG